jgi:hypothetical protein
VNARRANRIEIRAEVILDHRGMIDSEIIVPGMIVRRDNGTPQIARRSIKSLQIGQQVNNRSQTLPLVARLVNDPAARRSLNERNLALTMILERASKEPCLRRYQSLSRF